MSPMTSEETERDLVRALTALEDTRADLLHSFDGFERLQVQLTRAGMNVDQIAEMTARGAQWQSDSDFAGVVLEQVRVDSREVGTALADLGITQNEVGRRLDDATEHLVEAREALSSAAARAEYGPDADTTSAAVRTVRDRVQAAGTNITAARTALRHVDVSVAAGQAYLSGPMTTPEAARSLSTGAQLHVSEAVAAAARSLDQLDGGRDRTTHSAADVAALTEEIAKEEQQPATDDLSVSALLARRMAGPPSESPTRNAPDDVAARPDAAPKPGRRDDPRPHDYRSGPGRSI